MKSRVSFSCDMFSSNHQTSANCFEGALLVELWMMILCKWLTDVHKAYVSDKRIEQFHLPLAVSWFVRRVFRFRPPSQDWLKVVGLKEPLMLPKFLFFETDRLSMIHKRMNADLACTELTILHDDFFFGLDIWEKKPFLHRMLTVSPVGIMKRFNWFKRSHQSLCVLPLLSPNAEFHPTDLIDLVNEQLEVMFALAICAPHHYFVKHQPLLIKKALENDMELLRLVMSLFSRCYRLKGEVLAKHFLMVRHANVTSIYSRDKLDSLVRLCGPTHDEFFFDLSRLWECKVTFGIMDDYVMEHIRNQILSLPAHDHLSMQYL